MTPSPAPRGWAFARPVWLLGFVSLLTDSASEAIYPLLPVLLQEMGATALTLGVIEGTAEAVASLMKVWSGRVSDRWARRQPIILAGYGLSSMVRPLLALVAVPWHIGAIRFVDRVGKGVRGAPRDAMLAASATPEQRGRVFGFHRAMDHLGAVIGPLAAFAVLYWWPGSERTLIAWTIVPGILVVLLLTRVKDAPHAAPRTEHPAPSTEHPAPSTEHSALSPSFRRLMIALGIFALGNSSDMFLLLYLGQSGVAPMWLPLLWAAHHVVKVVASLAGGALADRIGRRTSIRLGWVTYAGIYLGFASAGSLPVLVALFVLYAVYHGLVEGAEKSLIADIVPAPSRGTAYGVYGATQGMGALAASVLFGAIWTWVNPAAAFIAGATLAGVAALSLPTD
jgi:MFS family permease